MSSTFEQTGVFASAKGVPARVLVVDDDASILDQIGTLLAGQDVEAVRVSTGEEAITLMARQWFPVIVTDDEMPEMDGIALVHRVRALAAKPTYVIMMTANADNVVMERGYCAGVDQYVSKKNMEAALPMRIAEGLKAIRLRRLGKRKLAHESVVTVDLNSGAHTARHLVGRLSAEIMLAQRTQSTVNVISLGVHPSQQEVVSESQLSATLAALKGSLRPQLDWVAWLHPAGNSHRFVVVLPSASSETATFVQSVRNTFVSSARELSGQPPTLSIGTFAVQPAADAKSPTAMEVLGKAESARRAQQNG
jgi:CheY-like chemotaxis protein